MSGQDLMSLQEADQITIFEKLEAGQLKQRQAAQSLGLSARQVRRKLSRYRREGAQGLIHRHRGRAGNNRINQAELNRAIVLVTDKYSDFGPTLAWEKLSQLHNVRFSRERLRQAMIAAQLWQAKKRRQPRIHQLRERRACEGELVQLDGSPHHWFEDRGKLGECTLLNAVDDATGKIEQAQFVTSETVFAYFKFTQEYLVAHGKPLAWYVDKHSVFRINSTKDGQAGLEDSHGLTQFSRAMAALRIGVIFANTPQAKGRVERSNQTLQDRLVKEMRLKRIDSFAAGNAYLPEFIADYNRRFAVKPRSRENVHRPLLPNENLRFILTKQVKRVLSKNLTLQYRNRLYQIKTDRPTYTMRRAPVTVRENAQGKVQIEYKGKRLDYAVVGYQPKAEIVVGKQLNQVIDQLKKQIHQPRHQSLWDKMSEQAWDEYWHHSSTT